jgi:hypothetical protein
LDLRADGQWMDVQARIGVVAWALLVAAGLHWLAQYKTTPGAQQEAPRLWPAASKLAPAPGRNSLLLFLHPQCPCSRATLEELAQLHGDPAISIVFSDSAALEGSTWDAAKSIRGATLFADKDGAEAKLFGAHTSGQVVVYDAAGRLQFAGGITASRGHIGDNIGRQAVQDVLAGRPARWDTHAVFGCAL